MPCHRQLPRFCCSTAPDSTVAFTFAIHPGGKMAIQHSRRAFLADVGKGVLVASVGVGLARDLGLAATLDEHHDAPEALSFGELEPLVCLMQETPVNRLLPALVEKLHQGTAL